MLFMKGTVPFAITIYPLNYGKISVVSFAIIYKCYFYCHVPLKISVVPFVILIFILCLQNSGENTVIVKMLVHMPTALILFVLT